MSALTASRCSNLLFVGFFVFVSADWQLITSFSGQNVTLTCRAPNNKSIVVEWSRADLTTEYVLLYLDGHLDSANQHPSFIDRVDLQDRQMKDGDASLILNNVTINDAGRYECCFFMEKPRSWKNGTFVYLIVPPGDPKWTIALIFWLGILLALVFVFGVCFLIHKLYTKTKKWKTERNKPRYTSPA